MFSCSLKQSHEEYMDSLVHLELFDQVLLEKKRLHQSPGLVALPPQLCLPEEEEGCTSRDGVVMLFRSSPGLTWDQLMNLAAIRDLIVVSVSYHIHQYSMKVNTCTAKPGCWNGWISDSYCSLKPLWLGMGEVVPARTSPTLLPPSPRTVLSLFCFKVSQCINSRDWHFKS